MILKWKPPEMNSLDFLLKIIVDSGPGKVPVKSAKLFVSHKRQMVLFGEMKYTKVNFYCLKSKIVIKVHLIDFN